MHVRSQQRGCTRYVPPKHGFGRCTQESLGGNAKTMIIANISPAQEHAAETASTLAFASRAKCIRNSAVVNQDVRGGAELMRRELERLQRSIDPLWCPPDYTLCTPSWHTGAAKLYVVTLLNM